MVKNVAATFLALTVVVGCASAANAKDCDQLGAAVSGLADGKCAGAIPPGGLQKEADGDAQKEGNAACGGETTCEGKFSVVQAPKCYDVVDPEPKPHDVRFWTAVSRIKGACVAPK